jgi:penicillin-binding protein 2
MRLRFLHLAVIFLFLFLAASLLNLEIIQGIKFKEMSQKNCIRLLPQPGARGNILDRNGKMIAGSSISYDIVMLPQEQGQLEKTLLSLSAIIDLNAENLKERFYKNYITPSVPVTLVKNISREKAITVEEKKPDLAGVMISPSPIRSYPYGDLACHVLGYLSEIDRWRILSWRITDIRPRMW